MGNKHKQQSFIKQQLAQKKTQANTDFGNFKVSFQYLDTTQEHAATFQDWQELGILAPAMDTLHGYCHSKLTYDSKKFKAYGNFPPKDKTEFFHPKNVPEDAHWARIHVSGENVLAGYVVAETFYVVFLDTYHKFWLTDKVTSN